MDKVRADHVVDTWCSFSFSTRFRVVRHLLDRLVSSYLDKVRDHVLTAWCTVCFSTKFLVVHHQLDKLVSLSLHKVRADQVVNTWCSFCFSTKFRVVRHPSIGWSRHSLIRSEQATWSPRGVTFVLALAFPLAQHVEVTSEVTTSVPKCHFNGMWEGVGRASGGFWLVSPFPQPLLEWHSDVLSCHLCTVNVPHIVYASIISI
jgi:hypothetical protein